MADEYPMAFDGTFPPSWILLTNGFEYNNYYLFSNNVKFTQNSRISFTRDLMDSLIKNNQDFILVLKCCGSDIKHYPMDGLKKSIIKNTVIYVYET
jgi:hypothetical protein